MGNCVSGCFGAEQKPADPNDRRFSHVFPTPLAKTAIIPSSDKHDDKFYFIKNEEEINKTIDKLDESTSMNDAKAAILEYTLADLRNQKNKLTYFPSYDSADNFTPVHEVDQEQERSPTESAKPLLILQADTSPSKLRRPNTLTNFSECSSSKMGKDISHGGLVIEVQKAHFLHPQFLLKHGLSKPYVVLKVYRTDMTKSRDIKNNKNWTELTKFQTMSASDSLKASWDELFEYRLSQDKKASSYSFGFTLFYMTNKDHMGFQVCEEQIFSIGSLLDQEMQIRLIDFKDSQYKGVLASTKVRFQFMHDQEILKERIVKEIKTKMERLCKIREKHPMFQFEKKSKGSIFEMTKRSFSKRGSEMSQSSTHENEEEGGYYVA